MGALVSKTGLTICLAAPFAAMYLFRIVLYLLGYLIKYRTKGVRESLFYQYQREIKMQEYRAGMNRSPTRSIASEQSTSVVTDDWTGVIGFFHPFCNAGGGGERVLWAAIAATQRRYPKAICVVYTGDHEINRAFMVNRVKERFDITLQERSLKFMYLSNRRYVLASTWPHFTLLGQSIGSLILAFDAFSLVVPDIFIDTMGYAFAVALGSYLFPSMATAAYVHYPTISTDMLASLDDTTGERGIHSGRGRTFQSDMKKVYWKAFGMLYTWVGRQIDIVMTNSTWTYNHINALWTPKHVRAATVVYPPCPVEELMSKVEVSESSEAQRETLLLYIAQFRAEKNHALILRAFAKYVKSLTPEQQRAQDPKLVLVGSVRSNSPDERHIYSLRLLARELKIQETTKFITDAPFSLILEYLQKASISVNGMYNEHFGIGNVEGLAAGLIPVVHNSGGPKLDIVIPYHGQRTGYHAENDEEYADAFAKIGRLSTQERLAMRQRGRQSALRFSETVFDKLWIEEMDELVRLCQNRQETSLAALLSAD